MTRLQKETEPSQRPYVNTLIYIFIYICEHVLTLTPLLFLWGGNGGVYSHGQSTTPHLTETLCYDALREIFICCLLQKFDFVSDQPNETHCANYCLEREATTKAEKTKQKQTKKQKNKQGNLQCGDTDLRLGPKTSQSP